MNTKCISSSAVKKNSNFHEWENVDIFTARDEIYLVFTGKKLIFFLSYTQRKIQRVQPNFFPGRFSFDLNFFSVFIGYNDIRCKQSLHI